MLYVHTHRRTKERETPKVATDYDELRSDVKESQDNSLEQLQSANAPDARSVVLELDEADGLDGAGVPGGEFVAEELVVQVIPQAEDEFTCYSCFLVRHRSQIARQRTGTATARSARARTKFLSRCSGQIHGTGGFEGTLHDSVPFRF